MPATAARPLADDELLIERTFDAPRELVFEAFIDPKHMLHWWGPVEYPVTEVMMDVRLGGRWRGCLKSPETGRELWQHGTFREVDPPRRLVFTFRWEEEHPDEGIETVISIDFDDVGGKTHMRFHQTPFATVASRNGHVYGWTSTFDRFVTYLNEIQGETR
jgi:uncharacterized protein YndB with AHSA1/START domain